MENENLALTFEERRRLAESLVPKARRTLDALGYAVVREWNDSSPNASLLRTRIDYMPVRTVAGMLKGYRKAGCDVRIERSRRLWTIDMRNGRGYVITLNSTAD